MSSSVMLPDSKGTFILVMLFWRSRACGGNKKPAHHNKGLGFRTKVRVWPSFYVCQNSLAMFVQNKVYHTKLIQQLVLPKQFIKSLKTYCKPKPGNRL